MRTPTPSRARAIDRLTALALTLALGVSAAGLAATAGAAPPTTDPAIAADDAATWIAAQVNASGFVPTAADTPNVSATIETALALALSALDEATFDRIVAWLQANVEDAIAPSGVDSPGNLGYLMMIARLAGVAPGSFGGVDLVARLAATLGVYEPGLYGSTDPTYDGVFRHSLALLGLEAAGSVLPPSAVAWLTAQQCDATTPTAAGGWQSYRADPAVACAAPDPMTFSGPDTNSTAMAVQALVGAGGWTGLDEALVFLDAAQGPDGGFGFIPGGDPDPNSEALVLLAIAAGGEDPAAGRWDDAGGDAVEALLSWQLGCDEAAVDEGAFASPYSGGAPDAFATRQAIWGAAGRPLPPTAPAVFGGAIDPCAPTTTTSTSTTTTEALGGTTTSSTTSTPGAEVAATGTAPAIPVSVRPALAG